MGLSTFLGKWTWILRSTATPRPWLRLSGHTWKNTISISSGRIPFLRIAWPPSNRTLMYEHSSTWICTGAPSIHQKTSSWRPSIEWCSQTPSSSVWLHQQLPLASCSRRSFSGTICQPAQLQSRPWRQFWLQLICRCLPRYRLATRLGRWFASTA